MKFKTVRKWVSTTFNQGERDAVAEFEYEVERLMSQGYKPLADTKVVVNENSHDYLLFIDLIKEDEDK